MQSQDDMLYSYIVNTKFYDYLRNRLSGSLAAQELKELVQGIDSVCRYKNGSLACSFDQPIYLILVYGEILYGQKGYKKGDYLRVELAGENIEMTFLKSTTLLLINYEVLEYRIQQITTIRQKMKNIERCMPVQQLRLTHSEIRKMAKAYEVRQVHEKYKQIPPQAGFFLLYQGIFQLCCGGIPILELQNNFIEIPEALDFTIRLKACQGTYGYISKQSLYALLSSETITELEKIGKGKQLLKDMNKYKKEYLEAAEKLRTKIQINLKKIKKLSVNEKSSYETSLKESLQASRKTMLQKCSTAVTTLQSFSPASSRKMATTLSKSRTMYLTGAIKQKEDVKLLQTQQKLNKLRTFSHRKQKTKLEKDWYHLDDQKMNQSLSLTYFKIKRGQRNQQQISTMSNYKRVHRIYSDPCFKKCLTFRNY